MMTGPPKHRLDDDKTPKVALAMIFVFIGVVAVAIVAVSFWINQ